jgi:hypothetical protein
MAGAVGDPSGVRAGVFRREATADYALCPIRYGLERPRIRQAPKALFSWDERGFFPRVIHTFCGSLSVAGLALANSLSFGARRKIEFAAFEPDSLPGGNGKNMGVEFVAPP